MEYAGVLRMEEQIVRTYADMVYRIAYRYVKNAIDTDDVFSEVFLAYFKKERTFESEEHRKAWLIRVTINKCRDLSRSYWRRNRESIEDYEYLQADKPSEIFIEMQNLPESYRNIIYLYYYEGYTVSEIAEILHMKVNTVKSGLRRAREKLKKYLADNEGESL